MKNKCLTLKLSLFIIINLIISIGCSNDNDSLHSPQSDLVAYTGLSLIDGISTSIQANQTIIINTSEGIIEDIFITGTKEL